MVNMKSNPRLKLNPAFQAAHSSQHSSFKSSSSPWDDLETQLNSATSGQEKLNHELCNARKTGKLFLRDAGILDDLPPVMFDIRSDLLDKYDYMGLDENQELRNHEKAWQCYGEEMLTVVDLSGNDLSKVPMNTFEKFKCFEVLQSLHIRNCNLSKFPFEILQSSLQCLREINAPNNKFAKVPLECMPESITVLNFANCCIENLGDNVNKVEMKNLIKFDLQGNKLVRLPTKLCTPSLQHAQLSNNQIEIIPKDFLQSCKQSLRSLDLSKNQLTLPLNLIEHSQLEILELRNNNISTPPTIHENLIQLGLIQNNLTSIKGLYPFLEHCNDLGRTNDGDWFRPKLKELQLRQNKLTSLDKQTMGVLTSLSFMNIADNALDGIPPIVGYLKDLNKIVLDGNPFRIIRSAISYRPQGGIDTEKLLRSLRLKDHPPKGPGYHPDAGIFQDTSDESANTSQKMMEAKMLVRQATEGQKALLINGRGLVGELNWPELIECLSVKEDEVIVGSKVSILNIAHGKLTGFGTEWVDSLPCLTGIDAQRNLLESLPYNLSQLPLKIFNCSRNCISSQLLQDVICLHDTSLSQNLVDLDLSNNNIEWVPDGLFDLNTVKNLNLSRNNIKSLEWERDEETDKERGWRHGLVSLECLDLSDNQLSKLGYLPLALFGCKHLHSLFLNNNCIYDIPLEIGLLEQIKKIDLLGNSQRKISMRVLTQNCSKILEHLREKMDDNQIAQARSNHLEIIEALKEEYDLDIDVGYSKTFQSDLRMKENSRVSSIQLPTEREKEDTKVTQQETPIASKAENITTNNQVIAEIKEEFDKISRELENLSLSQAKRFALKKSLAMTKSKLIREERRQDIKN